jgi:CxxC motif-containing protein (DUF1111 family)
MTRLLSLLPVLATAAALVALGLKAPADDGPQEAPASFQLVTNGFTSQSDFNANLDDFSQTATEAGSDEPGLGPTYNGTSCLQCHRNPSPGGGLSRFELRAGELDAAGTFFPFAGGTLVRQLAVDPAAQQRVPEATAPGRRVIVSKRRSTSLFGMGYVEVIRDADILAVRDAQPPEIRGTATTVMATTAVGADGTPTQVPKIGRFGWKCQQATLLDFAADALINEIGRTSPLQPNDMPGIDGRSLAQFKKSADPEDPPTADRPAGHDTVAYARLMRAFQAPPRDFTLQNTDDAKAGGRLFGMIGCAGCHVPTFTTAAVGVSPAGLQPVDAARGGKIIRPYSDFLLHDIGTGDTEVVQGGGPETRTMLRTAPLWGVRTVPEMGHDGRWTSFEQAIQEHAGQAAAARAKYRLLTPGEQRQLKVFLGSL